MERKELEARRWEPMTLSYLGDISQLVQPGLGKTAVAFDPGDPLKPPGRG